MESGILRMSVFGGYHNVTGSVGDILSDRLQVVESPFWATCQSFLCPGPILEDLILLYILDSI